MFLLKLGEFTTSSYFGQPGRNLMPVKSVTMSMRFMNDTKNCINIPDAEYMVLSIFNLGVNVGKYTIH